MTDVATDLADFSARGVSSVVFHAASASTGRGSVSR